MDDQSVDTEVAAEERLLAAMGEDDEPQEDADIEPEDGEETEGESDEPEIEGQLAQYKDIDWNALVEADPVQAMKLDRQHRELQAYYQGKVNDINQTAQQVQSQQEQMKQETLIRERQALIQSVPDWSDKAKFEADSADIRGFLANSGFNADEIGSLVDHRHVVVARKAMLYDKLMAGKPAVAKKVAEAPKPVKSTAPQTTKSKEAYTKTRQELRKTGRTEYAERAIEALLYGESSWPYPQLTPIPALVLPKTSRTLLTTSTRPTPRFIRWRRRRRRPANITSGKSNLWPLLLPTSNWKAMMHRSPP